MLLSLLPGALTRAQAAAPLTGRYEKEGGTLIVLEGDNETRVHYEAVFPQGASVGTCECSLVVKQKSGSRWTLQGAEPSDRWTLSLEPTRLILQGKTSDCCGAGWPGKESFERSAVRSPLACELEAPRAYFFDSEAAPTPRKAYVVTGDKVEVFVPGSEPDRVPARFQGSRKTTVGLLERKHLECPRERATPAGLQPVKAEQLQPFAGTWIALTRKGKDLVIKKPCDARTRSFTVRPAKGELEVQLGQETALTKITGLQAGAVAGSSSLTLTYESGNTETVTWTEVDASRGLVRLNSADLFSGSWEFVREDKKSAWPVQEETGCDTER